MGKLYTTHGARGAKVLLGVGMGGGRLKPILISLFLSVPSFSPLSLKYLISLENHGCPLTIEYKYGGNGPFAK